MSRSVNKIILVGNVGRDPEVRETKTGMKVANLSLATNRRTQAAGDEEVAEKTDWHRLVFWSRMAQFAEDYIGLGDRIYVEGRLHYDSYERDGVSIPTAEVSVREVVLLSPRQQLAEPVGAE